MAKPFVMDGIEYNVFVESLGRSFSVKDATKAKTTQDGEIYRDIIGTYYGYEMKVSERYGDRAALDAFWDAISQPVPYHVCIFPYNQETVTQKMYITSGKQLIRRISGSYTEWDSISVSFIAKNPRVMP